MNDSRDGSADDSRVAANTGAHFQFLLLVIGELCLAPVAQSMVTKLAPRSIGVVALLLLCTPLLNRLSHEQRRSH